MRNSFFLCDQIIPSRTLTSQEKNQACRIMHDGNTVLRALREQFKEAILCLASNSKTKFGGPIEELRYRLFLPQKEIDSINYKRLGINDADFEKISFLKKIILKGDAPRATARSLPQFRQLLPLLDIPAKDRAKLDAVVGVEDMMLAGHVKLVYNLARRLSHRCNNVVDIADLVLVGIVGLRDAVYAFDLTQSTQFSTSATHVVWRRMIREIARNSDIGTMAIHQQKLLAAYHQASLLFDRKENFDTIVAVAKFKSAGMSRPLIEKEIDTLRVLLTKFIRESDLQQKSLSRNDGKKKSTGISNYADPIPGIDFADVSFRDKLDRLNLSEPDRELIDMAIIGEVGFRSRWAEKYEKSRNWACLRLESLVTRLKISVPNNRQVS